MSVFECDLFVDAIGLRIGSLNVGIHFATGVDTAVSIRVHQDDNV
jgi:hypothetical protein